MLLKAQGLRAALPARRPAPAVPSLRSAAPSPALLSSVSSMSSLPLHRVPKVAMKTTPMGRRSLSVSAQAASSPAPAKPAFKWGANMRDLAICVGIAATIWFIPPPAGVTAKAWHLLAVFIGRLRVLSGFTRFRKKCVDQAGNSYVRITLKTIFISR